MGLSGGRVAVFSAVYFVLGLIAHSIGEGSFSLTGVLLTALLSVILAVPTSQVRIKRSLLPVLAIFLIVGQFFMHMILAGAGHTHGASSEFLPSGSMLLMHMAAGVVAAILAYFAESIWLAWSRFVASVLGTDVAFASPIEGPRINPLASADWRVSQVFNFCTVNRGPPLASLVP